ncbi:MAG: type II toxin-antitoxin system RelE/ParE family toxin [Candidatus Coatesbacteria bacterium]|nr:type II toxin-antitoxin system RelE/ParE family toxin [Candidatus Coatesbacteria bacterium]
MASSELQWKRSAAQDLRKLDKSVISKVVERIEKLKEKPRPRGCRKLRETDSLYRIRLGDYRIIYEILEADALVIIHHIRHRKDAYRVH